MTAATRGCVFQAVAVVSALTLACGSSCVGASIGADVVIRRLFELGGGRLFGGALVLSAGLGALAVVLSFPRRGRIAAILLALGAGALGGLGVAFYSFQ